MDPIDMARSIVTLKASMYGYMSVLPLPSLSIGKLIRGEPAVAGAPE